MEIIGATDKTSNTLMFGIAGELRVASELLIRGIGCCRPFVDHGVDLITDGGIRIQVKTAMPTSTLGYYKDGKPQKHSPSFAFSLRKWTDNEFYVVWLPDPDTFYIFPFDAVKINRSRETFRIYRDSGRNTQYSRYEGAWYLIEEANIEGRRYKFHTPESRLPLEEAPLPKRLKRKKKSGRKFVCVADEGGVCQ